MSASLHRSSASSLQPIWSLEETDMFLSNSRSQLLTSPLSLHRYPTCLTWDLGQMSLVLGNSSKLRKQSEIYLYIHKRMYGNNFENKLLRSLLLINILQETIVGHAIPSPHLYIVCEPMAIKKIFTECFHAVRYEWRAITWVCQVYTQSTSNMFHAMCHYGWLRIRFLCSNPGKVQLQNWRGVNAEEINCIFS